MQRHGVLPPASGPVTISVARVYLIVMAIFVPLSFLAGIYGMNFDNMPELHSASGYFILLSVMAAIALALLTVFRLKRWL